MKYTEEQLMELQLTDMGAYLRAISGNDIDEEDIPKKKKPVERPREKFPKEFTDVDDVYKKAAKKNKKKNKDYDDYSGNSFLDGYDEDDDEYESEYDGIASIYGKRNKKLKKQKRKKDDYYYYDDYIDEFSSRKGTEISDKEIAAYKGIRARINRLEDGTLASDEYTTLIKLCAVVAKMHTVEEETQYDDYDDEENEYDDDDPLEIGSITPSIHIGNTEVKDDEPEEEDEEEYEEEEEDDEEDIVEAPIESVFYTRYNTDFDRMAINSKYVSLNVSWGCTPFINNKSATPHAEMFKSMDEMHDFIKKYLIPYMCSHMHPTLVVKRQMFETTAKTNFNYDPQKWVFISRDDYVNCYYIDPVQYKVLHEGIENLASSYVDTTYEDKLANASLVLMNLIAELYRDASTVLDEEYNAVCTDDTITSNDRFRKFWTRFYSDKNELNVLPEPVLIQAMDYSEIQTAMFMFVSEWKEEDGDSYKDIDEEFTNSKPSEVLANSVVLADDPEAKQIFGDVEEDESDDVKEEPEVDIQSLMQPIPVHE